MTAGGMVAPFCTPALMLLTWIWERCGLDGCIFSLNFYTYWQNLKTANKPIGHLMGVFMVVLSTVIKNPSSCQGLTCCFSNNISLVFWFFFLIQCHHISMKLEKTITIVFLGPCSATKHNFRSTKSHIIDFLDLNISLSYPHIFTYHTYMHIG